MVKGFYYCPLIKNLRHIAIAEFSLDPGERGQCRKCGAAIEFFYRQDMRLKDIDGQIVISFEHVGTKRGLIYQKVIVHGSYGQFDVS